MSTVAKLAAFAAGLVVLFAGGALAGAAIGPDRDGDDADSPSHGHDARPDTAPPSDGGATHGRHGSPETAGAVRGLAVAQDGLRIVVETPEPRRGRPQPLRFRIVDPGGETVRDFDVEHTKRMHLLLARRDLTGFQHLHPEQRPDGSWATTARIEEPGAYRLFADFSHEGAAFTLASDLRVDGDADLRPLPEPRTAAVSDGGYAVRLDSSGARAGREAQLRFAIAKDGEPVHVEPYLGAGGHLVALREGDLAFLHVHPTGDAHETGAGGHGEQHADGHDDAIGFAATFPTAGRYRLFLQFQHAGEVQTVAFTQVIPR